MAWRDGSPAAGRGYCRRGRPMACCRRGGGNSVSARTHRPRRRRAPAAARHRRDRPRPQQSRSNRTDARSLIAARQITQTVLSDIGCNNYCFNTLSRKHVTPLLPSEDKGERLISSARAGSFFSLSFSRMSTVHSIRNSILPDDDDENRFVSALARLQSARIAAAA